MSKNMAPFSFRLNVKVSVIFVSFLVLRRVYTMRQKHATMRHASKSHCVNGLIATCDCRKKVG